MADSKRIEEVVNKDWDERVYHKRPAGMSPVAIGVVVALIIASLSYLAFTKSLPFSSPDYELNAMFESSVTVRETAPVRIAGVNVGEVTAVTRKGDGAEVTFTVDADGRPIHDDATATLRPRLFLEGNLFVDLTPGSPSAPTLDAGDTLPVTQTAEFVQLDEILTALQQDDREALSKLLRGYSDALTREPTAADDATQDPDVHGKTAAEALNAAFGYGGRAGKGSAQVSEALRGTQPRDLERLLRGGGEVFSALAESEAQLRALISNFNTTAAAFAAESNALRETIVQLAGMAEEAEPALVKLNATFPPLRRFSRTLTPAMGELQGTIDAGFPWLRQTDPLLSDAELGGLARILRRSTPDLVETTDAGIGLLEQIDLLSRCTTDVLVPTGDTVINDDFSTGVENYKEFFYGLAAQAGEGQGFDGNGTFLRVQPSGGGVVAASENPKGGFLDKRLFTHTISAPLGTQPVLPAELPPLRPDVPCHTNDPPDLNGPAAAVGPPSPEALP